MGLSYFAVVGALSFSTLCAGLTTASAQTKEASVENLFFEFFNSTCLLNMPQLDKVRATARLLDWKPITGDAAVMLAPSNPNAPFEGWAATYQGRNFFIGLSEGVLESKKVVICAATERKLDQEVLVSIIETNIKARIDNDEIENMQRYRGWVSAKDGESVLLHLTTSATDRLSSATLAVFARAPR